MIARLLAAVCLACAAWGAQAAALDQLKAFVQGSRSGRAEFTQTVTAKSGRQPQRASGTMAFQRPGKFRWTYAQPYQQLIIGDGEKLWIYDKDLNQVTVRKLGDALGSSPAALLAGDDALEKNFQLSEGGSRGGIEWVEATPKSADTSFERVRIGFADGKLRAMELIDTFGQTTILEFTAVERNPRLEAGLFSFTPPKGADVVGE